MVMNANDGVGWELVELDGGPAHGLRMRVLGQARVLQVTYPCAVEPSQGELASVQAVFVYRRDVRRGLRGDAGGGGAGGDAGGGAAGDVHAGQPVRYGFDPASP